MAYKYYTKNLCSTVCHILEFNPKEYRFDITIGKRNVLEKLSKINGETKNDEVIVAKLNGGFFDMSGKSGDTYSTLVDEGLYYHPSIKYYPTLVFWKNYKLAIEHDPDQKQLVNYQRNAFWAIGAAWTLVVNGKIDYTYSSKELINAFGHTYERHPRTMVGQKADGTIVWVATDGRVSGSSGLSIDHEAIIMLQLGCVTAVNMDGGGSTEMIIDGIIKNKLAGGVERTIGTAFMMYGKKETVNTTSKETCPYNEPTVNISIGSKGEGAKWVQWYLNKHGNNLIVDGDFGSLSKTALLNFQSQQGLTADGVCGKLTRAKLKKI